MKPVNGDALRGLCDHAFWHNAVPREDPCFRHGDLVFCKIDEVWRLFRALRRTRNRIVLVSGEGDKPVDAALWTQKPPQVSHWFGTNHFVDDPTGTPLPLGLGNAGSEATLAWEQIAKPSASERKGLLYANFRAGSNPAVRQPLLDWLEEPAQAWITREDYGAGAGKERYLERLRSQHFVLCPPGNGEDTHRMWEALYSGAIPVVRESRAMREFLDLPVLAVPDLRCLNEAGLRNFLEEMPKKDFSLAKLNIDFWRKRMQKEKELALAQGPLGLGEWVSGWSREIRRMRGC